MEIKYSPHFLRSLRKLPPDIAVDFDQRLEIFQKNHFNPRLRTHKLGGRLKGLWSFSVTYKHRIVFRIKDSIIEFLDIDDHDIYR